MFFFVATYGNKVIFVGGHKKTQTYQTVHAFRSTIQNLPLRTRCAQGGPNISNFEDEMCPRWASFSNFKLY